MEKIKKFINYIMGEVYVPRELIDRNEKILLHVSDTPTIFFSALKSLIKKLSPDYIIHTGDLVDDIKIEIYPYRIHEYEKRLRKLIQILEGSSAEGIYIAIGNHDDKNIVKKLTNNIVIIEKSGIINIEGNEIKISHFPEEIVKSPKNYNFFGHNLEIDSKIEDEKVYLNGISNVNILTLESKKIYELPYPQGTNDSRLGKSRIGF